MKWITDIDAMTASGYCGWSRVSTLVEDISLAIQRRSVVISPLCGRITRHHLFITADYLFCGV
jgi:hypothetical protein